MYSEQLEQLIKSVIADGVITEKERAVLHKKAAAEGIDEDEIDVYIDGLIAEMKPASNPLKKDKRYDLSKCNKTITDKYTYYQLQRQIDARPLMPDCPLEFLKIIIMRIVTADKYNGFDGLTVAVVAQFKKNCEEYGFSGGATIETNMGAVQLSSDLAGIGGNFAKPSFVQAGRDYILKAYKIDEEILEMLCNVETAKIRLSFMWIRDGEEFKDRKSYFIDNANLPGFNKYAQLAYHVFVDDTAYRDAEEELIAAEFGGKPVRAATSIKGNEEVIAEVPKVSESPEVMEANGIMYAKLLGKKTSLMQKDKEDIPCWNKFTDPETGSCVYHFYDDKSLSATINDREYRFSWLTHAIQEKNKETKFIFELTCSCIDKFDDNNEKLPKIPFGLTEGGLLVNAAGENVLLPPMTKNVLALTGQYEKIKGDERCYYEVPSTLISIMLGCKELDLKVFGSDNKSAILKSMFGGISMPKKWHLACNLIIHPEQKELLLQEYHNSLISTKIGSFFKKLFVKK